VKIFYGSKVVTPLLLAAIAAVTGLASLAPFLCTCGAGRRISGAGLLAGEKIEKRQKKLTRGLPDVLDLLVICMEAGLSLDQATARSAEELRQSQPEMCDELNIVVLEQRAGRARSEAWKNMAERTGVESVCATWFRCWCRQNNLERALPKCSAFTRIRCACSACKWSRRWRQDFSQASVSAGAVYFSCAISGYTGTSRDRDG
jgi:hypothetical protein